MHRFFKPLLLNIGVYGVCICEKLFGNLLFFIYWYRIENAQMHIA